tara:strand:- start:572 stop:712 length:141 start_codon:yes stop_codon:yes gene_type:complete
MTEETISDEEHLDKIEKRIEFFLYTTLVLSMMGFFGVLIYLAGSLI